MKKKNILLILLTLPISQIQPCNRDMQKFIINEKEFIETIKDGELYIAKQMIKQGFTLSEIALNDGLIAAAGKLHSGKYDLEFVKILLKKGADINAQDKEGWTALHFASYKGFMPVVNFLLNQKEININIQSIYGNTALSLASSVGDTKVVELLLKNGADINNASSKNCHPLIKAIDKNCYSTVKVLLENGADVNHVDSFGHNALYYAFLKGIDPIVELLLKYGSDIPNCLIDMLNNIHTMPEKIALKQMFQRHQEKILKELTETDVLIPDLAKLSFEYIDFQTKNDLK